VNTAMSLWVMENSGYFMTSCVKYFPKKDFSPWSSACHYYTKDEILLMSIST
jgi:hypothetical protein